MKVDACGINHKLIFLFGKVGRIAGIDVFVYLL
jgi:hypothetical protein